MPGFKNTLRAAAKTLTITNMNDLGANVIKLFTAVTHDFSQKATAFVPASLSSLV
jgi:hypothetical protein